MAETRKNTAVPQFDTAGWRCFAWVSAGLRFRVATVVSILVEGVTLEHGGEVLPNIFAKKSKKSAFCAFYMSPFTFQLSTFTFFRAGMSSHINALYLLKRRMGINLGGTQRSMT